MNIRSVAALLLLRWVNTCRCPFMSCRCRHPGNWCWLLVIIQLTLTTFFIISYDVFDFDTFLTLRNRMLKKLPTIRYVYWPQSSSLCYLKHGIWMNSGRILTRSNMTRIFQPNYHALIYLLTSISTCCEL